MLQIDEKFKDESPENTVARIRTILKNNHIAVIERPGDSGVKNCHSINLSIENSGLFSNGKGVTETLALASAYAEMMERLQSGRLGDGATVFSDAISFTKEELLAHCKPYFTSIAKANPKKDGSLVFAEEIAELSLLLDGESTAKVLPYYNVTRKKMTYFPQELTKIYATTGLAAGNTTEEALVQGLCEILERNSKLHIMRGNIVPPTIPTSFLQQYPNTYETIVAIEEAGYDVIIKDCSLQSSFPILGAVLIDKETHCYHVHMGCHPIFEIALRRTLTETFQGRTLANVTTCSTLTSAKEYQASNSEIIKNMHNSTGSYPAQFFGPHFSYAFTPYPDRTKMNNKALLCEILEYVHSLGYEVLVRDHSSLGFPTFRILVPGFCETCPHLITEGAAQQTLQAFYKALPGTYTNISPDRASLRIAIEQTQNNLTGITSFGRSFASALSIDPAIDKSLYFLNFAFLEWAAGHTDAAYTYLSTAISLAPEYDAAYLHCLQSWMRFQKAGDENEEIAELLSPFYHTKTVEEVKKAVQTGNPFRKYAHDCAEIDCGVCQYQKDCMHVARSEIKNKINAALVRFDDKTAFEKLQLFFKELS